MTIIVDTKPVNEQSARWIEIFADGPQLAIRLHYTDKRSGCYVQEWLGFQPTLGA